MGVGCAPLPAPSVRWENPANAKKIWQGNDCQRNTEKEFEAWSVPGSNSFPYFRGLFFAITVDITVPAWLDSLGILTQRVYIIRPVGELPEGAWVGTVHKAEEGIVAFTSKTFYGYELPAPDWVPTVVRATFK